MINISNLFDQAGFDSLNVWIYFKGSDKAYFTSTDTLKARHPRVLKLIRQAWSQGKMHVSMYRLGVDEIQFG